MTKAEFDKLSPIMQDIIAEKAEECGKELKDYLAATDDNYCIFCDYVKEGRSKIVHWQNSGVFDYVVYGDKEEAEKECEGDSYVNIITETEAIKWLDEYAKQNN